MKRPDKKEYVWDITLGEFLHEDTGCFYSLDIEEYIDHLESKIKEMKKAFEEIEDLANKGEVFLKLGLFK